MFTSPSISRELVHMRQRELTEQSRRHRLARQYGTTPRRGRRLAELAIAVAAGLPACGGSPSNLPAPVIKARPAN
jgi:hypothetical protein